MIDSRLEVRPVGPLPAGVTVYRALADVHRDTYLSRPPIEPYARRLTLSTDATLLAVGAQPDFVYGSNGHRGLWPDDIDEWTPSELLLQRGGWRPGVTAQLVRRSPTHGGHVQGPAVGWSLCLNQFGPPLGLLHGGVVPRSGSIPESSV